MTFSIAEENIGFLNALYGCYGWHARKGGALRNAGSVPLAAAATAATIHR